MKITLNRRWVQNQLPKRAEDAHKGDFGRVLLLCGSLGYTGAAYLSAMGALRSGAGLVYLGVPQSIYAIEAVKLNEAIIFPLSESDGKLSEAALPEIRSRMANMDAVLIGPGLGRSEGADAVVRAVLREFTGPVVVDADGINGIAAHMDIVRERRYPTVFTPHPGEFFTMGGDTAADRVTAAKRMAEDLGITLVLKGHNTVVTDGKTVYVNPTGNPGMAVGGSGDILAGMIVSLIGQGLSPLSAAACGVYLHGLAGDVCAKRMGQYGMLPSDMLGELPRLMK